MEHIINGGLYRVVFSGKNNSEFDGEHPTLIVRTLKEYDMYIVIPLTSYTKEKWTKCKSKGFAVKINDSRSIARIDKFKVIHKSDIKNRWKIDNQNFRVALDDLKKVNSKLNEYIELSSDKALRTYEKYYNQYDNIFNSLVELKLKHSSDLFSITTNDDFIILKTSKNNVNQLSKEDIREIVVNVYDCKKTIIELNKFDLVVKVPKH